MIQLQFLNYVLETKDFSLIQNNGFTVDYFTEYPDEFLFIKNHYDEYKKVPDIETFLSKFDNFSVLEVKESERYLVNTLNEEYLYVKSVPVIKKTAELLKVDANEASRYLQSELPNLMPNYQISAVDIIHSDNRVKLFEDKSKNPDKWFIPTGFQELDDALNGWQMGEEFVVIYARTGQGKSWVLVKSMQHAWLLGKNVGYISPEMSADKIGYRFDTLNEHLSNMALVRGNQNEVSLDEYQNYFEKLSEHKNKFLVSTPADFNRQITVGKLRNYVVQNNLDILAIDGIKYLKDERYKKGDNLTTSLTNISEDLMQLSIEMSIPILVVVQSNRGGVKEDPNATPDIEDIRDSDGISHNSTKIISLKQKEDALIMEVKKHRDGIYGTKLMYSWDIDTGEFVYHTSEEPTKNTSNETTKESKPKGKVVF